MATLYWKSLVEWWRDTDPDKPNSLQDGPVNEQHPLPAQIFWREDGTDEWQPVEDGHPLPARLTETVRGGMWISPRIEVPGITAADALDANDALGGLFTVSNDVNGEPLPSRGVILAAKLIDPDDDTLAATLHVFSELVSAAASDAAFTISAPDSLSWVTSISLSSTTDIGGAKVAEVNGWNSPYYAAGRKLYCQLSTTGTPNIAAGRMPQVQLFILPFAGAV